MREQLSEMSAKVQQLNSERASLVSAASGTTELLSAMKSELEAAKKDRQRTETMVDALTSELRAANQAQDALSFQLDSASHEIQDLIKARDDLAASNLELSDKLKASQLLGDNTHAQQSDGEKAVVKQSSLEPNRFVRESFSAFSLITDCFVGCHMSRSSRNFGSKLLNGKFVAKHLS
jgi:chromosome segregation ATPase